MEVKAVVTYLGGKAHYHIIPEASGIYLARLIWYEGADVVAPPENVTLTRGARHWVGSAKEQYVVDELGKALERRVRGGDPHAV